MLMLCSGRFACTQSTAAACCTASANISAAFYFLTCVPAQNDLVVYCISMFGVLGVCLLLLLLYFESHRQSAPISVPLGQYDLDLKDGVSYPIMTVSTQFGDHSVLADTGSEGLWVLDKTCTSYKGTCKVRVSLPFRSYND